MSDLRFGFCVLNHASKALILFSFRAARANNDDAKQYNQADPLGGGKAKPYTAQGIVSAQKFHTKSNDGIACQVDVKKFFFASFFFIQPIQYKEEDQIEACLQQLYRKAAYTIAAYDGRVCVGESDGGFDPVAAPHQETADSGKKVEQWDGTSNNIVVWIAWILLLFGDDGADQKAAQHAAVENLSAKDLPKALFQLTQMYQSIEQMSAQKHANYTIEQQLYHIKWMDALFDRLVFCKTTGHQGAH